MKLVEQATPSLGIDESRDMLVAMMASRCSRSTALRDLLALALAFGDAAFTIATALNAVYSDITEAGFAAPRAQVVARVLVGRAARRRVTRPRRCSRRRSSSASSPACPCTAALFLRLAEDLREATPAAALDDLLAFHRRVQRERSSGDSFNIRGGRGSRGIARPDTPATNLRRGSLRSSSTLPATCSKPRAGSPPKGVSK